MIRALAIGSVLGCMLAVPFVDLDEQARATYYLIATAALLVLTLTPRDES